MVILINICVLLPSLFSFIAAHSYSGYAQAEAYASNEVNEDVAKIKFMQHAIKTEVCWDKETSVPAEVSIRLLSICAINFYLYVYSGPQGSVMASEA